MARKTNKTSHVMNLLTNGAGAAEPAPPAAPAPGQGSTPKITVVDEADTNNRLSAQIASKLSRELSEEQAVRMEPDDANQPIPPSSADAENPICFINVMEELVRKNDIEKLMREYDVCTCSRCRADVCALSLSNLPPKYIVAERASLPPLLSYYESRYRITIFTQLIKACMEVRSNPRHSI